MAIRCHHLGLFAGLALALSVAAASQLPELPAAEPLPAVHAVPTETEAPPVPAPVLFLAGGLLAVAAAVRWRQKLAAKL